MTLHRRTAGGLEKAPNDTGRIETAYFSGAGGLVSTAEDDLQFAQMLPNGGELNGRRFLSPKTVELMATNHVGELYASGCAHQTVGPCDFYDQRGMGFGLGVDVVRDPVAAGVGVSAGSFGWAGAFGTRMWVDPKERMVTVLLVSTRVVQVQRDFEYAVRPGAHRVRWRPSSAFGGQRSAESCQLSAVLTLAIPLSGGLAADRSPVTAGHRHVQSGRPPRRG